MATSRYLVLLLFGISFSLLPGCSKKTANWYLSSDYDNKFPDLSVFPGAEGYGTKTIGGRGGDLYIVTNLKDNGPGSLRNGVSMKKPRIIVFEVSGTIFLKSQIYISDPFLSIFGQTAPGHGITLSQCGIIIETHDVLIQHLAVRPGDSLSGCPPDTRDGIAIINQSGVWDKVYNIIIDHCSMTWAIDENASVWNYCSDITFSNCIIGQALHNSLHSKGPHSKGLLVGANNQRVSIVRNIFAFNDERNPRIAGNTSVEFVNNLVFHCNRGIQLLDIRKAGPVQFWAESNIFIPENLRYNIKIEKIESSSKILLKNNVNTPEESKIFHGAIQYRSNSPFLTSGLIALSKDTLLKYLLENTGMKPNNRNLVDADILQNIEAGKGQVIDCTKEWVMMGSGNIIKHNGNMLNVRFSENRMKSTDKSPVFISFDRNPGEADVFPVSEFKTSLVVLKIKLKPSMIPTDNFFLFKKCQKFSGISLNHRSEKHKLEIPENLKEDRNDNGYSELEDWIYSTFNQ